MKLKVSQLKPHHHKDMVTAVCWSPNNEVYACSDDKTISVWNSDGEVVTPCLSKLHCWVTDIAWFPLVSGGGVSDTFVIGCSDGCFIIMNKSGREEKKVKAHDGALISLKWSYDGNALVTAGEDGSVKLFSKTGMLRSTIARCGFPVYTICWAPDNNRILFSSGRDLILRSTKVDRKQLQWKAHDGVVLKTDWNVVNGNILSCGEDCKYKVWDNYGRMLYQSKQQDYVVTSIAWCPNGELFAVGAYNQLRLCDKTGWTYSREKPDSGSLMSIAWSSDGANVAGGGGNRAIVFGHLVERRLAWKNLEATLTDTHHVTVCDVFNETVEKLDFLRHRIIEMSLGYSYLIVTTAKQCFLYDSKNWNTPQIVFDLRHPVNLIVQNQRHFVLVNNVSGLQVYNYEGRLLYNPRFSGLRAELLNKDSVSVDNKVVAILDRNSGGKMIRLFDIERRQPMGIIKHSQEILTVGLNQFTRSQARMCLFIDRNYDLHIATVSPNPKIAKVATMVDTAIWNDCSDMLTAIADGVLVTWLYPYPALLYGFIANKRWEEAVRLCRFVKMEQLWAALAGMAIAGRNLNTAEIALAAIKEIDKLQYILHIKNIPSEEGRSAELALFRREPQEAERILLQASPPLVYRAIKMNIRLFKWHRALELAVEYKTHVDTVLAYRQRFLKSIGKAESDGRFIQYDGKVKIDWDAIKAKQAAEKEKESKRKGSSNKSFK